MRVEGQITLLTSCVRAIADSKVSCEVYDGNHFLIHCPKDDDTSLPMFSEILRDFILSESRKKLDMFQVGICQYDLVGTQRLTIF